MTSQHFPSWYPKRGLFKVEIPSKYQFYRRSSRIRDKVGVTTHHPDYEPEKMALSDDEKVKKQNLLHFLLQQNHHSLRQGQQDQPLKKKNRRLFQHRKHSHKIPQSINHLLPHVSKITSIVILKVEV